MRCGPAGQEAQDAWLEILTPHAGGGGSPKRPSLNPSASILKELTTAAATQMLSERGSPLASATDALPPDLADAVASISAELLSNPNAVAELMAGADESGADTGADSQTEEGELLDGRLPPPVLSTR